MSSFNSWVHVARNFWGLLDIAKKKKRKINKLWECENVQGRFFLVELRFQNCGVSGLAIIQKRT